MNAQELIDTARALVAGDKGLLAMDESNLTCNKRFARLGIPQTKEARRAYRELIVTTPGLGECISGAILYDETIRQEKKDGTPYLKVITDAGIIPSIKVDTGAKDLAGHPGEKITEGLDGLRDRLAEYSQMGARFAKWRAVIAVGDGIPSRGCIEANAEALARYAALCQESGLVPVVEPEVLMDGAHTLERCLEVTEEAQRNVFIQLNCQRVMLEGMILKPNMVLPGLTCPRQASLEEVADATVEYLLRTVPAAVPGIALLSGGQSAELASARLNAMNVRFKSRQPWALAFSFARAIQQPALEIWQGQEAHVLAAQQAGNGQRLIDEILDVAKQKGTGMWTSQSAMELQVPIPTIDLAVAMRDFSVFAKEREQASGIYQRSMRRFTGDHDAFLTQMSRALFAAMIIVYAQGLALLAVASEQYDYHLDLEAVARIWRGGCIIRAALLEEICAAFHARPDLPNLLLDPQLSRKVMVHQEDLRRVVCQAAESGVPVPGLMVSLGYLDAYRSAWLPANLIQAQRDYFGAHTYERIDAKGTFHTEWQKD